MSIIKVDRVRTIEEALALEAAGATTIGIHLGLDPRCPARGYVSSVTADEIRRALTTAKFCVMLDPEERDPATAIGKACALHPDFLQISFYSEAEDSHWKELLYETNIPIVYDVYDVSYETEPSWVFPRLDRALSCGAALIQIDLLNDIPTPWRFLHDQVSEASDEFIQLNELVELTENYPVLISMEISPEEAIAFCSAFPAAAGVFFRLPPGDIGPTINLIAAIKRSQKTN